MRIEPRHGGGVPAAPRQRKALRIGQYIQGQEDGYLNIFFERCIWLGCADDFVRVRATVVKGCGKKVSRAMYRALDRAGRMQCSPLYVWLTFEQPAPCNRYLGPASHWETFCR